MKQPTQLVVTDQSRNAAILQPDFYVKLRQMAMSEEFQIGLKIAAETAKGKYPIGSENHHLHGHAVISELAITNFIETIYDTFVNPPELYNATGHGDLFAND